MKTVDALLVVGELAASQWGLFTAKQAQDRGVTRLLLSRLANVGQIRRLAHGVYRDGGAPSEEFEDLRAAWLSTDPSRLAEERIDDGTDGITITGPTAAALHAMGDLRPEPYEFSTAARRQTQRDSIRFRHRELAPGHVTIRHGLPVTTVARTIADLVEDRTDLSLVADVLRDAVNDRTVDLGELRTLLAPLAARNGYSKDDGASVLEKLLELGGIDAAAVAKRTAAGPLGQFIAAEFLQNVSPAALLPRETLDILRRIGEEVAAPLRDQLAEQLAKTIDVRSLIAQPARERLVNVSQPTAETLTAMHSEPGRQYA